MCRVMRQEVHNTPWSQKFILLTNTYTLMMYDEDMLRLCKRMNSVVAAKFPPRADIKPLVV